MRWNIPPVTTEGDVNRGVNNKYGRKKTFDQHFRFKVRARKDKIIYLYASIMVLVIKLFPFPGKIE